MYIQCKDDSEWEFNVVGFVNDPHKYNPCMVCGRQIKTIIDPNIEHTDFWGRYVVVAHLYKETDAAAI